MAKKKSKEVKSDKKFNSKIIVLGLLIVFFWFILLKVGPDSNAPPAQVNKSTAQLQSSQEVSNGFGTAVKTYDGKTFDLNVSGFLAKSGPGTAYYVYLKNGGEGVDDILLGKMQLMGDVYGFNYTSSSDLYMYSEVEVVQASEAEIKDEKAGKVVLKGEFSN